MKLGFYLYYFLKNPPFNDNDSLLCLLVTVALSYYKFVVVETSNPAKDTPAKNSQTSASENPYQKNNKSDPLISYVLFCLFLRSGCE